jgi:cytidine deaminase
MISMKIQRTGFEFEMYDAIEQLSPADAELLEKARAVTASAYAPYSSFYVGAAALLDSGAVVCGTNQENASFPAGICAEQAALAAVASLQPNGVIRTMAISYQGDGIESDHPISPCGVCRQVLTEYEGRVGGSIRLILGGMKGPVYIIPSAQSLLPLAFTAEELP